jgi:hypothetical protein
LKKLFSIVLIALILLNTMGYYAVFVGLQFQNDLQVINTLDAGKYDKSQTFTIKIPVSIPYKADQTEFERVDGEFAYEGEFYRTIKQKYAADTLTIICYKDPNTKIIQNALADYVKTFTDKPNDQKDNAKIVSFIKDYITQSFSIINTSEGWQSSVIKNTFYSGLIPSFYASINHPPERS